MRRLMVGLTVTAAAVGFAPAGGPLPAGAAPAPAAVNMAVLGFNDLGGGGLNGEVAVVGNTVVVAAGITGDTIPHQHLYSTYACNAVSVKVVDISDPTRPAVAATIPVEAGVAALDVDALRVSTPTFTGDLAAVALARCDARGNPVDRGVAYYDISVPATPKFLGRYIADSDQLPPNPPPCGPAAPSSCAQSEHAVALVQRADGKVLSLSTQPFSYGSNFPSGDLRVVDVTDPRRPDQLGSWPSNDDVVPGNSASGRIGFSKNGCRPIETGHAAEASSDGLQALVAYQDEGLFTLDMSNPLRPRKVGQAAVYDRTDRTVDGTAAQVTSAEFAGRKLALLSDDDLIAPTSRVRIDSPSSLAGSKFACEAMFTLFDDDDQAQVYRKPGAQIAGDFAYIGRGCPLVGAVTSADPYLNDPAGKIAVIDHTRDPVTQPGILPTGGIGCGYDVKVRRAQDAGAIAVVMRRQGTVPEALSEAGSPAGLRIPMFQVDTTDGDALRATLCPAVTAGACTGATRVTGALVDTPGEWGGMNVIDNTDPANARLLSTYRPPTAAVFPPPDLGVYGVHHAEASGNRAFVAANADGLRVVDLSNPARPVEIASFVPPDTIDPTGQLPAKAMVTGVALAGPNVVISDTHTGLYVLALTGRGYRTVSSDGGVFAFGGAEFLGSAGALPLARPIVGTAGTPSGHGYWLVASDGGVFAFGDAAFRGSTGAIRLNRPIVGMASTPSGAGYWLVASDGGVFAFGDARFLGSTGNVALNRPIVSMASTPSGRGYWLVASDGGVFAFGDARFLGSTGAITLNRPVVGAAATPSGRGYWLVASDGGVFAFGDAGFMGSAGALRLSRPMVAMAASPSGRGYWLVASDGGVFAYGDAPFRGTITQNRVGVGFVSMAALP